ncbi:6-carboxytetrahydropterin synthase [Nitratireductor aquimarinus]|uniref:6-carboxy-5,6,7,8-tetrahydropterin synthase n=1 Tax=Nitratireductor aquimarinus TaxID=889300 RepID=A0ABU4AQ89_9HYPH|nr:MULTISPECIES: 6-carboxytetrahydropterin synthase [Alphaproteobacteria]MBN7762201.1 6-carboxytetrahydropterin synthase [Nitratireductor aquibiodomus]MBN7778076.1 6-carboxytetrahydropterin synthase [Nitratireductor pacificus]MBY6022527.1 6-carboxytetrahydropterin synthase [Nitratireductor sp. DP7N14-4]MBN7757736.1 6-carboxytetrahydropterin synthase [Nitratireductor aquimarinus]MBN7782398.1 6-carboxytetrahydropterin synthase [Nitratireductor pacificus]
METYKEFTFEAAHKLEPYSGLHGHSFKVSVHLVGEPDPVYGWAANLYEVEQQIAVVHKTLDHTYLNEIDGLSVPSLENLAKWIFDKLSETTLTVDRVEVKRGPDGQAEGCVYSPRAAA